MRRRAVRARISRPFARSRFFLLVRHFLRRLSRTGAHPGSGEADLSIGPLLGLLAAPGAFASLLLLDKYSTLMSWMRGRLSQDLLVASLPDKLMFVSLAMSVAGIATVLRLDRLLPDAQDYTNLTHLPIRPRMILLANIVAVAVAATVVAVATNVASTVFFPAFVVSASLDGSLAALPFMAVHAICVGLASLFAFLTALGVMGVLICVLPGQALAGAAGLIRAGLLIGFAGLVPASMVRGAASFWFLPPVWFTGLYQRMQGRPAALAEYVLPALAGAFLLASVTYAVGYARTLRGGAEMSRPGQVRGWLISAAPLPLFRAGDRAVAAFVIRGLMRNPQQRLALTVSLGLGWLPVLVFADEPASLFGTAYLLMGGLRLAFVLPAMLPANWVFRSLLENTPWSAHRAVRSVAMLAIGLTVLVPSLFLMPWTGMCCLAAFALTLVELFGSNEHRIPFTCPFPGFRQNLPMTLFLHVLGVVLSIWAGARLMDVAERNPLWLLPVGLAPVALWIVRERRWREDLVAGDPDAKVSFPEHQ